MRGSEGADQACKRSEHCFDLLVETFGDFVRQIAELVSNLEMGSELEERSASDQQEVSIIAPGPAATAFGDIGRDGCRRTPQLLNQPETLVCRKGLGDLINGDC